MQNNKTQISEIQKSNNQITTELDISDIVPGFGTAHK
jgi:hypothetical protein